MFIGWKIQGNYKCLTHQKLKSTISKLFVSSKVVQSNSLNADVYVIFIFVNEFSTLDRYSLRYPSMSFIEQLEGTHHPNLMTLLVCWETSL